jgi:hypothetical protein
MGMDVSGLKPTAATGAYFRNSIWWWHPLADYCAEIAPDIAARCQGWHYNEGDGLGRDDSRALADVLQREIDSGRCETYARAREAELATLPNHSCEFCAGAGELTPQHIKHIEEKRAGSSVSLDELLGLLHKFRVGEKCPCCKGTGSLEPRARNYAFSVENVQRFVAFLRACGGFRIC